ncbi:MAG TPA: diaminopimelate epimerase [Candidatus Baltobacteraceae bacterium]|nr:diaminopimelate epimerase [Candidatus Baltobacteraceae bacterium]
MTPGVAVTKMHGARNDFVVVDARATQLTDVRSFARRVCDRHEGIGADGLLLIGTSSVADVSMRVINSDGSEAEICGNGIRCVARYLDEASARETFAIETLGGVVDAQIVERGGTYLVCVRVPQPHLVAAPPHLSDATAVVVGNPHVVIFTSPLDEIDLVALGEGLQHDPLYPEGVNVHVARIADRRALEARHYERGAGLTMACGTGCVAIAVAAHARGAVDYPVRVRVPGGDLVIDVDDRERYFMTGPAMRVFETVFV